MPKAAPGIAVSPDLRRRRVPRLHRQTEMDKVQAVVDFVNLMTYEFRTSDPIAGHHANLSASRGYEAALRRQRRPRIHRRRRSAGKVVVGVPFYGRAWADITG